MLLNLSSFQNGTICYVMLNFRYENWQRYVATDLAVTQSFLCTLSFCRKNSWKCTNSHMNGYLSTINWSKTLRNTFENDFRCKFKMATDFLIFFRLNFKNIFISFAMFLTLIDYIIWDRLKYVYESDVLLRFNNMLGWGRVSLVQIEDILFQRI